MHPGEVTTVIMKFELPSVPFAVPSSPRATVSGEIGMGLSAVSGGRENRPLGWSGGAGGAG
jgi:hypothetical protein